MADEIKIQEQELRKCSQCGCTKLLKEYFAINKKGKHYKTCDHCREKGKVWREQPKNREKAKQYREQYYKQYREKNREKLNQKGKQYS